MKLEHFANSSGRLNILLVYKRSGWEMLTQKLGEDHLKGLIKKRCSSVVGLREKHNEHQANLETISEILDKNRCVVQRAYRSNLRKSHTKNCWVITVGGDGTLLDASHYVKKSPILGVNSNPSTSVGSLCALQVQEFEGYLESVLAKGMIETIAVPRIQAEIDGKEISRHALNEVLVSHRNPAGTSMYVLNVDGKEEHQKSAGIWIAGPAGSTAALASAGGKILPLDEEELQLVVREPYFDGKSRLKHTEHLLHAGDKIQIISKMLQAHVYMDGPHHATQFPYGACATFMISPHPLNLCITDQMLKRRQHFAR